ncbi:MAG TPA: 16S rRNA (guanine(966)-N(2))-methyltransferase RsmD [Candidatus Kapabacteria bacterium]|jgi:16S rRNA (guanine966-N2)-methyltransferase|nr:16S rRNA (guanine(966)-N(2))-methyltransferase RsmD [Candidatus Kapabacteria bacterium]
MRIIAGAFKSRTLVAPPGSNTRPTTDRARETLFNVLTNLIDFSDIRMLDLFAGSGAVALEAISRGAGHATLIEQDRKAVHVVKENIRMLGVEEKVTVIFSDVFNYLKYPPSAKFDLIFADAPYNDKRALEELPSIIILNKWLTPNGICVIEHRSLQGINMVLPQGAKIIRELKAGEAAFTILQYA